MTEHTAILGIAAVLGYGACMLLLALWISDVSSRLRRLERKRKENGK